MSNFGLHLGVVTDRNDPEHRGRVRVRIPGLLEPESAWALPLGTAPGGAEGFGFFAVPPVGAEVGVLFAGGAIDRPCYLGGPWGRGEAPDEARTSPPDVVVLATQTFCVELSEAAGARALRLVNRHNGDRVEIDAESNTVSVVGTTMVEIRAEGAVSIDAPVVTIRGRVVRPVVAGI